MPNQKIWIKWGYKVKWCKFKAMFLRQKWATGDGDALDHVNVRAKKIWFQRSQRWQVADFIAVC